MKRTIIFLSIVAICILLRTSFAFEQAPKKSIESETINIKSATKIVLPDLIVTEIYFDKDCHLKYTIKNIGGAMTETAIPVILEDKDKIRLSTVVLAGNVKDAGGQETFTWLTMVPVSQAPFVILVNPSPSFTESNYDNNSKKTKKGLTCGTSETIVPGPMRR